MLRKLFKRGAQASAPTATDSRELPAEVAVILEAASVFERPADEKGRPRLVFQLAGSHGWLQTPDEDARQLKKLFPSLNEHQLRRALRMVASIVHSHMRVQRVGQSQRRSRWVTSWMYDAPRKEYMS